MQEKNPFSAIVGKMIVTKEGKRLGYVKDITFETRSGELISIVVRDSTPYTRNLNLERTSANELLVPYNSIIAIGDFVIVSEEDLVQFLHPTKTLKNPLKIRYYENIRI